MTGRIKRQTRTERHLAEMVKLQNMDRGLKTKVTKNKGSFQNQKSAKPARPPPPPKNL